MSFWLDIAAFALKALLIVAAIGGVVFLITRLTRGEAEDDSEIKVNSLNERYDARQARLNAGILSKKERKALAKQRKALARASKKAAKSTAEATTSKRIYVLGFKGDIRASAVGRLGREIDAVLTVARPDQDEVVVRIESPGGTVTGYGLAASQLLRLRAALDKAYGLRRSGRGERRVSHGLRRRQDHRRAVCDSRQHRRRRETPQSVERTTYDFEEDPFSVRFGETRGVSGNRRHGRLQRGRRCKRSAERRS